MLSQWHNYWDVPLTNYVRENLKHNLLHDVAINFRNVEMVASPLKTKQSSVKAYDMDTVHKVTLDPIIKNPMTSEASPLKTNQSPVKAYDMDTVHEVTLDPVIKNPMTSEASHLQTKQSSVKVYDADNFHKNTPDLLIKNPMTSDEILNKICTRK